MQKNNKVFTIPNILSVVRICLIPVFAWLYCVQKDALWTTIVLTFSGATDVVDGFIARRFHMISDIGKALDPVADKLTQTVMLICLLTRFPLMWLPLMLMVVKEISVAATGLMVIKQTGNVHGADWHGKVTTCLLYAMMVVHVLWVNIPTIISTGLILLCVAMMLLSFLLYVLRNIKLLKEKKIQH